MALTYSQTIKLGTPAPGFALPAANPAATPTAGETCSLDDFGEARALVVVFTCNHCPYAKHVEDALIQTARAYAPRGVAFVAISPNDADQYPEDGIDRMAERARAKQYPFPYLYDATQAVTRAYKALCTPDLFIYDGDRRLVYHGRVDESRPGQGAATGRDLRRALDDVLEKGEVTFEQRPAMGCSIKWRPGNAPPL